MKGNRANPAIRRVGPVIEPKPSSIGCTVSQYVQKSTIHGVAYVGDDERNKFERLWWFVMIICSVVGACYLIYQAYRTMKENPIIESAPLTRTTTWEVPFPAVTICPLAEGSLNPSAFDKNNWPDYAHEFLPDNFTDLAGIGGVFFTSMIVETLLLRRSDQNNHDILTQFLPEIVIDFAIFGDEGYEVFLQKTITQFGACLTFNMYPEKDILRDGVILSSLDEGTDRPKRLWSRDSGFNDNLPRYSYTHPFRSFAPTDAFMMYFSINDSARFSSMRLEFAATFHAPDELPLFGRYAKGVSILPGNDNHIKFTSHLVVSEGIEHYAPDVRQCYYSGERYLTFFKNYTLHNCEKECIVNYTLARCGCVPYHIPHFSDTKLCTTEFLCYIREATEILLPNFVDDVGHAPIDKCNCLPSCTQLSYEPVRTKTLKGDTSGYTSVHIQMNGPHIIKHVRTELHSISEFFSNCGGSLGLFLGVSIFSIMELLYFCTVRLYLNSKKRIADSTE